MCNGWISRVVFDSLYQFVHGGYMDSPDLSHSYSTFAHIRKIATIEYTTLQTDQPKNEMCRVSNFTTSHPSCVRRMSNPTNNNVYVIRLSRPKRCPPGRDTSRNSPVRVVYYWQQPSSSLRRLNSTVRRVFLGSGQQTCNTDGHQPKLYRWNRVGQSSAKPQHSQCYNMSVHMRESWAVLVCAGIVFINLGCHIDNITLSWTLDQSICYGQHEPFVAHKHTQTHWPECPD